MIRFLLKLIARLIGSCVVLFAGCIFVARLRSDPFLPIFTNPDGVRCSMPCLFGIRPGETAMQEAITLVQLHPLTSNLRLFVGDFSETPKDNYGIYQISYVNRSILFAGQGGQAVVLQIYAESTTDRVSAACLRAVYYGPASAELPHILPTLARMWHSTSFYQMIATLGPPESISHPSVLPTQAMATMFRLDSFYYEDQLAITHSSDGYYPPDFNRNFFGSVCVYSPGDTFWRFASGYHGRSGAALPWLGVNATIEDYKAWAVENNAEVPEYWH